jgi:hypothetical protein
MAVGDTAVLGFGSYVAIGRETAAGTYNTCTAGLDFISCTMKTQKDLKILEQIERTRTYSKALSLGKSIGGDLSCYWRNDQTALMYLLQNAFGGSVTNATATGETTGGASLSHIFATGIIDQQSFPSLCVNLRKGPATGGKVFAYSGVKVNEMTVAAEIDEPLRFDFAMVGMDSSVGASDVETNLTATAEGVLSFVNGRLSIESSFASLTSSSFWHVQSFQFKLMNNLKTGNEARRIGSSTLAVLPAGIQNYDLTCNVRFNTTTAFDAMVAGTTEYAGQFEFLGDTYTGSVARRRVTFDFQKLMIKDAGDPEISGPDNVLTSQITFAVLRDESATGYAVRATVVDQSSFTSS